LYLIGGVLAGSRAGDFFRSGCGLCFCIVGCICVFHWGVLVGLFFSVIVFFDTSFFFAIDVVFIYLGGVVVVFFCDLFFLSDYVVFFVFVFVSVFIFCYWM
jgi:hypothetical protein